MSNNNKKNISRLNALLIIIATLAGFIILLSALLHINLVDIEHGIEDFATHHFFLTVFISSVVLFICIKLYNDTPENITSFNILKKHTRNNRILKKIERIEKHKNQLYNNLDYNRSKLIEKEILGTLSFMPNDVLLSSEDLKQRENDLNIALKLGNTYKHKVKIFFRDIESNKHLETTIWQLDDQNLTLKRGLIMPIKSIYKVQI